MCEPIRSPLEGIYHPPFISKLHKCPLLTLTKKHLRSQGISINSKPILVIPKIIYMLPSFQCTDALVNSPGYFQMGKEEDLQYTLLAEF